MSVVYVVDTGYLLALYRVPGQATDEEANEVARRMEAAIELSHDRLVPVAVIYELARHVAQTRGSVRYELATRIADDVRRACELDPDSIFSVDPSPSSAELVALLAAFATDHAPQGHSLTDVAVLDLAHRAKRRRGQGVRVHLWTWERRSGGIRSLAPDEEPDPFP